MADWGGQIEEFRDRFGRRLLLLPDAWRHIGWTHPEIVEHRHGIATALLDPDLVKRSRRAGDVLLYYRYDRSLLGGKYLLVVAKVHDGHGEILTAYATDSVKVGEVIWERG